MLTLALLLAQPAAANSCALMDTMPLNGPIATSASLYVIYYAPETGDIFRLFDSEGSEVPSSTTLLEDGSTDLFFRITPDNLLAADANYSLKVQFPADPDWYDLSDFATGSAVDTAAPQAPTINDITAHSWPATRAITATIEPANADEAVYYEVQFIDIDDATNNQTHFATRPFAYYGESGSCGGGESPDIADNTTWNVRARAIDMSGNVGPWSDESEPANVGGCSTSANAPWALWPLVGLLGLVRRKQSTSAQGLQATKEGDCLIGPN